MDARRNILYCLLMTIVVVTVSQSARAQVIPDSILKNVPMPALGPNDTIPVPAVYIDGEIIPGQDMGWQWVTAPYPKHLLKRREEWTRLRNAIYVTYPYARKAGIILNEINAKLAGVTDKEQRKKYIKTREKELKKEFADPLTNLSIYQGKVLMKLINRQTGNNCYEIIKEYKGGFTARVWQTVAFFFNSNLKQPYNANGDEQEMEKIVLEVERMYRM
ncbi:MAG: DUF4294 domain-containing protein [Chitinophagaceae bacterium]